MESMLEKLHNVECDFYELFKDVENFPTPKIVYTQKSLKKEKQFGVIIMEDLSETAQTLGIFVTLQTFQVRDYFSETGYQD